MFASAFVSFLKIRSFAIAGYSYLNLQVFTLMVFSFIVEVSLCTSLQFQVGRTVLGSLPSYSHIVDDEDDEGMLAALISHLGIEMQDKFLVRMNQV
jgi:hypothetical protein